MNIDLTESIVLEMDENCNPVNKLKSNLSESFQIVKERKDLTELKKTKYNPIQEQNYLHQYHNLTQYTQSFTGVYTILQSLATIKNFIPFIPFLI